MRDVDKDVDPYALEMLGAILDGHDAARFNKKHLVREQRLAISAGAGTTRRHAAPAVLPAGLAL
jgi:zinc protease